MLAAGTIEALRLAIAVCVERRRAVGQDDATILREVVASAEKATAFQSLDPWEAETVMAQARRAAEEAILERTWVLDENIERVASTSLPGRPEADPSRGHPVG